MSVTKRNLINTKTKENIMANAILFKRFTNLIGDGSNVNEADLQEAERMVQLSHRVEDGKEAKSELVLETTEVATNPILVGKLNAMLTDQPFSLPSGYRYPSGVDFLDGIGFDGKQYFVETAEKVGTEFIGNEWKELKAHAKAEYEANHCNHKAVTSTLDMLRNRMNEAEFSKNTLRVLKSGQLSVNIKAKVGPRKASAGQATGADILATMQAKLAKAKQSNTDES